MFLPQIKTAIPGPQSLLYAQKLALIESSGITYLSDKFPVFWQKANGINIWDIDDNCFLDLNSAFGVAGPGHGNASEAVREQALNLIHGMGDVHPPKVKVDFMEKLVEILPANLNKIILSCNGSDACESALKTMQVYTKKSGIIAFEYGYHGLGYGALDLTHKPHFRKPFEQRLSGPTFHAPYPSCKEELAKSLKIIKEIIENNKNTLGGIIVEPIQGRGGVIVPPKGFLKELRNLCDKNDLLLILDEIYTGFGRTGKMFAFEHENIIPDLLCLGKTIGGGLPLSICVGSSEIMSAWGKSNGEAIHTSTFLGNPLACAAGLHILNELQSKNWTALIEERGQYFKDKLQTLKSPFIKEIRGKGLMLGIELVKDLNSNEPFTDLANHFTEECLQRGLIVLTSGKAGHVISLSPPFMINKETIDFVIEQFQEIFINLNKTVQKFGI